MLGRYVGGLQKQWVSRRQVCCAERQQQQPPPYKMYIWHMASRSRSIILQVFHTLLCLIFLQDSTLSAHKHTGDGRLDSSSQQHLQNSPTL